MCEWISVEERLPEPGDIVQIASTTGLLGYGWRVSYENRGDVHHWQTRSNMDEKYIAYWLPIPPLPIIPDEKENDKC